MDTFNLETFLPYQLSVLSRKISDEFAALYRQEFGISMAEWRVIAVLSNEGKISVREIHDRVGMDKSKVSRAAARLQAAGLLDKNISKKDRRLIELELTESGCAMMKRIAIIATEFQQELDGRISKAQTEMLQKVVSKL